MEMQRGLPVGVASSVGRERERAKVADHVPNARIRQLPGAGHAALLTHPEALAEALTEFFSPAQQPA